MLYVDFNVENIGKQTDRQAGRQTDRQTDRQTCRCSIKRNHMIPFNQLVVKYILYLVVSCFLLLLLS